MSMSSEQSLGTLGYVRALIRALPRRDAFYLLRAMVERTAWFWSLRATWRGVLFGFERRRLGLSRTTETWNTLFGEAVSIGMTVVRLVGLPAMVAIVVLAADAWAPWRGLHLQGLRHIIAPEGFKHDAFVGAASAIAQVAVVVLGLYYAALSVVASTVYARASNDIRALFMSEPRSRAFMLVCGQLAVLAGSLLIADTFGASVGWVALVALVCAMAYSVLGLVAVTQQVFDYFDPSRLVPMVESQLDAIVDALPQRRSAVFEPSLFQHYRRRSRGLTETLLHIERAADSPSGSLRVGSTLLRLFLRYSSVKASIPENSTWYLRREIFQEFASIDYNLYQVALAAGSTGQVERAEIIDRDWFEAELTSGLEQVAKRVYEAGGVDYLTELNSLAYQILQNAAEKGAIVSGTRLALTMLKETLEVAMVDPQRVAPSEAKSFGAGIGDTVAVFTTGLALGLLRTIHDLRSRAIHNEIRAALETLAPNIRGVPVAANLQLQRVRSYSAFEGRLVGAHVTPVEYGVQLISAEIGRGLADDISAVLAAFEDDVLPAVDNLLSAQRFVAAAAAARRCLEGVHKLQSAVEELTDLLSELGTLSAVGPSSRPNIQDTEQRLRELRTRVILLYGNAAARVPELRGGDTPDFLGHAYSVLAD